MGTTDRTGASVKGRLSHGRAQPTTAAVAILATENPLRMSYLLWNEGLVAVYLGSSAAVTTTTGFPLQPGDTLASDDDMSPVYGITASGTGDIRYREVSALAGWHS